MNRRFFVIGDIEMGKGDLMDDFHDDDILIRFIEEIARVDADEITLLLNGDTFDFLKMDYQGKYPRYITEEISLWKLEHVLEKHAGVFEAFKKFLESGNIKLVFIIGNHDPDLVWPKVQQKLRGVLAGNDAQVVFTHAFDDEQFHVQHGNLIDPLFGFDHLKPVIQFRGRKILNLPLGAHMSAQYLIGFKKKFHQQEVMYPQHEVIKKYPEYKRAITFVTLRNSLRIFVLDPIIHFANPMYRIPYFRVARHLWRYGFDGVHDDKFLDIEQLEAKFGKKKVYVLAHAHVRKDLHYHDRRYIFLDCWRTERDVRTEDLRKKPKTYVEIAIADDQVVAVELKVYVC